MSSFPVVKSESVGLAGIKEAAFGVLPASGSWQTLEPQAGGISNFYAMVKTVAPSPLSAFRQLRAPQIVDLDATPGIKHDLTADLWDLFGEGVFLSLAKHPISTGRGAYLIPSARTTTAFTVTANFGAMPQNTLVVSGGWVNAANNGLFVVGAGSTGTSVPVAGGVAETPSGYLATLEVAGFRGTTGDIGMDANGNLTSTTLDFTTLTLAPGQVIWIGGTIGGGHDFATAAYRGFAKVSTTVPITAHLITFQWRSWTVGSADTGTGKTIDLYYGRWFRDVAFTDADYVEPSYSLELSYPSLSDGSTVANKFVYALGNIVNQIDIEIPAQNLVTAQLSFLGTTIGDPTTARAATAAAANGLLGIDRYNSVTKVLYRRISDTAGAIISDDIETAKIMFKNNASPQKQHGALGSVRTVVGKAQASADVNAFLTQDNALKACTANTTVVFGYGLRNNDGGFFWDMPACKITKAPPSFPQNGPVSLALTVEAFQDPVSNITAAVSIFPFLPVA